MEPNPIHELCDKYIEAKSEGKCVTHIAEAIDAHIKLEATKTVKPTTPFEKTFGVLRYRPRLLCRDKIGITTIISPNQPNHIIPLSVVFSNFIAGPITIEPIAANKILQVFDDKNKLDGYEIDIDSGNATRVDIPNVKETYMFMSFNRGIITAIDWIITIYHMSGKIVYCINILELLSVEWQEKLNGSPYKPYGIMLCEGNCTSEYFVQFKIHGIGDVVFILNAVSNTILPIQHPNKQHVGLMVYYTCGNLLNSGEESDVYLSPSPIPPNISFNIVRRIFNTEHAAASDGFIAITQFSGVEIRLGDGSIGMFTHIHREPQLMTFLPPTAHEIGLMAEWLSQYVTMPGVIWRLIAEWLTDVA